MTDQAIDLKLVSAFGYRRWPCHVCGGTTERVSVLVEAETDDFLGGFRCCENCLRDGDLDGRLEGHAHSLERYAARLRSLIGRLKAPTYEQWRAQEERVDVAQAVARSFQGDDIDDTYNKVMADDDVYAKWRKQLQQEEDDYNGRLEQERQRRAALGIVHTDEECPF